MLSATFDGQQTEEALLVDDDEHASHVRVLMLLSTKKISIV